MELFTDFRTRQTRGCGFVHYVERRSAEDAIAALGGAYTFPGGWVSALLAVCGVGVLGTAGLLIVVVVLPGTAVGAAPMMVRWQ